MSLPTYLTDAIDSSIEFVYSFEPLVEPTVVLVPDVVREQIAALADTVGFDVPTCNTVLAMYLSYILALVMNLLPFGKARHIYNIFCGAFLLQLTVGVQWIHQVITAVIAYSVFLVLPRKTAVTVVPTFVMLYCVMGHLHRQYVNYMGWDLDFTSAQMVITQKLWMLAYNLYDGEVLAAGKDSRAAKKCAPFALKELPDLIEYLGYVFSGFSGVISGPVFEFSIYRQACDGSHMYNADGTPKGKIPSNVLPTLMPLLQSFVNMGLFLFLGGSFPLMDPVDPQKNTPYIITPEFLAKPWIYRYGHMWLGLLATRQKYLLAWANSEGNLNACYAGFEGFDKDGKALGWNNSRNMEIWDFETAPSLSVLTKSWNTKTSLWLARYVYMRTNGNLVAVYSTSAFWHGFYPGYYLFFLSVPLATFCERLAKKKISPYFSSAKWSLYGIASILLTSLVAEYLVISFTLLGYERTMAAWGSHYFFGHIGAAVFYVILTVLPSPKKADDKVKKS